MRTGPGQRLAGGDEVALVDRELLDAALDGTSHDASPEGHDRADERLARTDLTFDDH